MSLLGSLVGGVLGMMLFGALFSWALRLIFPRVNYSTGDLIGIVIALPLAITSYAMNGRADLREALWLYSISAVLAYPIMRTIRAQDAKRGYRPEPGKINTRQIARAIGWVVFALLLAAGSTSIFMAFRSPAHEAPLSFFVGSLLLIICYGLHHVLRRTTSSTDVATITLDESFFTTVDEHRALEALNREHDRRSRGSERTPTGE